MKIAKSMLQWFYTNFHLSWVGVINCPLCEGGHGTAAAGRRGRLSAEVPQHDAKGKKDETLLIHAAERQKGGFY